MVDLPISEDAAYLSVRDVAALFRISTKTVRRWIKSGKLPATQLGRDWRVARKDLHALAKQRGNQAAAHVL
ncbi:helix-turn-helix domain-containing protein [Ruegeria arenilitoris]|uniref:helix-turn-helix domain-containing protein n=1 Tax=Ruegeria arenilitoris TaxID=1173585 RepID=UPI001481BC89|nr:helix-turn-helix domain-containing protein [Ruegeria arenilitoris]